MADTFGFKLGVEGEKEFKKTLADINQQFKVIGSEMNLVSSQFDKQDKSVQALSARNGVLNKEIEAQKSKIEVLRQALQNASESFGENDKRTQAWQIQLNNAEAALNKMEREVEENNAAIAQADENMDEAADSAEDMAGGVEDAGKESEKAGPKFSALGTVCAAAAATLAAAFAAVTAASVAAGKALINMSKEGAAYADTVIMESTITGIATDKLQEYMYAAELVDVSVDTLTGSMTKNIKNMKSAADGSKSMCAAYDQLGISVTDANGNLRDSDEVYWEVIDALSKVENETERNALGMTLLGKSAQDLNPLIEAGSQRMTELGDEARKAGYVLSDETLSAYGAFDDQLQKLNTGAQAAKNALGTILLPVLTDLAGEGVDLLGEFTNGIISANGDISKIGDVIGSVLPQILDRIMAFLPQLLSLIGQVIVSLGKAITDNLPVILSSAGQIALTILSGLAQAAPQITSGALQVVVTLAQGILSNLGQIFQAACEVVISLVSGITENAPLLLTSVCEAVILVCQTLLENLPLLLETLLSLVEGLASSLINDALPILLEALPEVVLGVCTFIQDALPQLIETVLTVAVNLLSALPQVISIICGALPQITQSVSSTILGAIPLLIQTGVTLLTSLISNLPGIIVQILTCVPQIISSICSELSSNIPLIIRAGFDLLVSLITNLPSAIIELVKAAPQIISSLCSALLEGLGSIADVGVNLVRGLWDGIQSLAGWLWDKVSGWISDIWDGILDFFGIASPSKKMKWAGSMLVEGLSGSIDSEGDKAVDAAENLASEVTDAMSNLAADMSTTIPTDFSLNGSPGSIPFGASGPAQTVINIYPQSLDEATVDYLFARFNLQMGAAV